MSSPVVRDDSMPAPVSGRRRLRFDALDPGERRLFALPAEDLLPSQAAHKTRLSRIIDPREARADLGDRLIWDCGEPPPPAGRRPVPRLRRRHASTAARTSRGEALAKLRRRAHHALRRLPWTIAANYPLTQSAVVLLDLFLATPEVAEASVAELAARCGISQRAVQYAANLLIRLGLLLRHERRRAYDRNDTNRWDLAGPAARAAAESRGEGARACGPEEGFIFKSKPTSPVTSGGSDACRGRSVHDGRPRRAAEPSRPAPRPDPASRAELHLACRAIRHADPEFEPPSSAGDVWNRVERLIRAVIPIYPRLWAAGVRRHGFRAALAVLETAILRDTGHVRHPAAYLAGILRKPPAWAAERPEDACCPQVTLSRLFAARDRFDRRRGGPRP